MNLPSMTTYLVISILQLHAQRVVLSSSECLLPASVEDEDAFQPPQLGPLNVGEFGVHCSSQTNQSASTNIRDTRDMIQNSLSRSSSSTRQIPINPNIDLPKTASAAGQALVSASQVPVGALCGSRSKTITKQGSRLADGSKANVWMMLIILPGRLLHVWALS